MVRLHGWKDSEWKRTICSRSLISISLYFLYLVFNMTRPNYFSCVEEFLDNVCFACMVDLKGVWSFCKVLLYYSKDLFKNLHLCPLFHVLDVIKAELGIVHLRMCRIKIQCRYIVLALGCLLHKSWFRNHVHKGRKIIFRNEHQQGWKRKCIVFT